MKDATIIKLWMGTLIAILEAINLTTANIDGAVLSLVIGAICGLGGYELRGRKKK